MEIAVSAVIYGHWLENHALILWVQKMPDLWHLLCHHTYKKIVHLDKKVVDIFLKGGIILLFQKGTGE